MGRYIDADKAKNGVMEFVNEYGEIVGMFVNDFNILLERCSVDVQEVRHGEWVFKFYCGNMSGYDYGMNCSVCGKPMYRQFAEKMSPYCQNCGAKMDELSE